mgnify:CR=1 FL=1
MFDLSYDEILEKMPNDCKLFVDKRYIVNSECPVYKYVAFTDNKFKDCLVSRNDRPFRYDPEAFNISVDPKKDYGKWITSNHILFAEKTSYGALKIYHKGWYKENAITLIPNYELVGY